MSVLCCFPSLSHTSPTMSRRCPSTKGFPLETPNVLLAISQRMHSRRRIRNITPNPCSSQNLLSLSFHTHKGAAYQCLLFLFSARTPSPSRMRAPPPCPRFPKSHNASAKGEARRAPTRSGR
ncbi:uncharacterized protein SCHCODRAFT_01220475 [Schizophyllum commune H4-8]|uniref:uncharacterized protein n=1 Tax=Schizophyllum commune (strain H4-8 / FGSC 9210) TaxID=578458 RepID=UPI00215F832C|nr:uncharacterized protein SCHCODRAFT_01220475 [Schizophyllum commune H4-8]KAI5893324.1 hypothetical protein SCHCODRAFT_01220475 [Schizophyllum commune H4-8]